MAICTCAFPRSYKLVLYKHFVLLLCCVLWEGCSYCNMMCAFPGFSQSTVDFCAVSWSVFLWLQHASFPLPPWQPQQFIRCYIVIVWFAGKWRTLLCIHVLAHHWADFFCGCLLSAEESVCLFPTYITQSNDRHCLFLQWTLPSVGYGSVLSNKLGGGKMAGSGEITLGSSEPLHLQWRKVLW